MEHFITKTKLKRINSDTVGWIEVESTNIGYPIVQTTDNNYYLTHSFDKASNDAGWVFMDYRNSSDGIQRTEHWGCDPLCHTVRCSNNGRLSQINPESSISPFPPKIQHQHG